MLYGVLLVVIINFRPKGLFGHEEINLKNLPKLFVIIGLTIGLTIASTFFNEYYDYWGRIPAGLAAAGMAIVSTVAISYLGRGLAKLLAPVMPIVKRAWDSTYLSIYERFKDRLTPVRRQREWIARIKTRMAPIQNGRSVVESVEPQEGLWWCRCDRWVGL